MGLFSGLLGGASRIFGGLLGGPVGGVISLFGGKNIAIAIGIASTLGIAYLSINSYIKHNVATINRLNEEVSTLKRNLEVTKVDNETLKHNINVIKEGVQRLNEDHAKVRNTLTALMEKDRKITENYNRLHEKLYRESRGKKSLEELGLVKPKLVQAYMNKEIKRLNECAKALTGGVKNEKIDCSDFGL